MTVLVLLTKSVKELPKIEIVYRRLNVFLPYSGGTTHYCTQLSEEILEPA